MPFNIHEEFTIMDADDILDNDYHIASGSRIPYSQSTYGTLTTSDNTAGLGDSSTTWNTLFCGDVYCDSITTADRNLYLPIASETLTASATSIEFTGLNGDDYESYFIVCYITTNDSLSANMGLHFNGQTASGYGYQYARGVGAAVGAARVRASDYVLVGILAAGNAPKANLSILNLYSKTGNTRAVNFLHTSGWATNVSWKYMGSGIWSNTSSTITSMKFHMLSRSMSTGTTIQIWGRK